MTISRASIFDGDHERKAGASDGYDAEKIVCFLNAACGRREGAGTAKRIEEE